MESKRHGDSPSSPQAVENRLKKVAMYAEASKNFVKGIQKSFTWQDLMNAFPEIVAENDKDKIREKDKGENNEENIELFSWLKGVLDDQFRENVGQEFERTGKEGIFDNFRKFGECIVNAEEEQSVRGNVDPTKLSRTEINSLTPLQLTACMHRDTFKEYLKTYQHRLRELQQSRAEKEEKLEQVQARYESLLHDYDATIAELTRASKPNATS